MVTYIKNKMGYIRSFVEWTLVDESGRPDDKGMFLFVRNMWVHDKQRAGFGKIGETKKFIKRILRHPFCRYVLYVYWTRKKYNDRKFIIKASDLIKKGE
jgi:hypothetical protein